jgi:phospholipid/cholesterol/gamma-HCH transport system substrate-binding protein
MPRRATWRELIVGLVAAGALAVVAFSVLVFARVGQLHGNTFRLFAMTDDARGVIRGTEVWLGGQKVGLVKDVRFLPPSADTANRVLIVMDVLTSARQGIRGDSKAQIRSGGTLIGSRVVYISIGTSLARELVAGDTVGSMPQSDLETMTSEFAIASRDFPEIIRNVKLLNEELHGVNGTLGAFGLDRGGVELTRVQSQMSRLASRVNSPSGTVGLALRSQASLADRARATMARADSVRALLASDRTSYGRFRRDSTLIREVADIRNELDVVRARMTSPTGTLGRMRADSAVIQAVAGAQREMTLILADIHRRPLRYIHF